ncbi:MULTISPECIES: anti-sigma factor [Rhizobiaceae]|jgi:anti-sigma-K factor RskA|uniref:Anti-sigma-K factor RskA n=1 Tax=Aliirhizobium cellulosilyticum TaxID=393664 RepID=A0A7W6TGG3_9HYPH|nr:anti-sigma factor [Rhizobium cellulosilyticum]MBB4348767.1 anti-sigma-K factor RskA [Rhizobium cellulosilyticum]MBB4413012.1 anti-sigma-K factor RskA [Rhizobium cellulosilyticum]MBB4447644.1 anti-sigma-K factor RskA [Rhizobium cellulosilyticum]
MKFATENVAHIADEYVLGLLSETDVAEVENEIERNATLATAVAEARERFLPLDTNVDPAAVSPVLWQAIEARLPEQAAVEVPSIASVSPRVPTAGNDNVRSGWRSAAISAIAASLILAVGLVWSVTRTIEPLVVAVLVNEAGEVQAVVEDFGNDTASIRLLADFSVPEDKTMQVWTLPSREMGPMSLGLLEDAHSARLSGSTLPKPQDAQLYEITLEQAGGSPTGRPTGPILAKGFAKLAR